MSSCKQGFTDCDGTCRDLSHDSTNCGACNNVCATGTDCRPSTPVVLGRTIEGQSLPVGGSACTCIPPAIACADGCRNPINDPSNCGTCGNVCTAPTTACRNSQCALPDETSTSGTAGSTGDLPLDLFWSTTDPNGLPFNPDWRGRSDPALLVKDHNFLDIEKACPISGCVADCVKICSVGDIGCLQSMQKCGAACMRRCTAFPVTSGQGDGGAAIGSEVVLDAPPGVDVCGAGSTCGQARVMLWEAVRGPCA